MVAFGRLYCRKNDATLAYNLFSGFARFQQALARPVMWGRAARAGGRTLTLAFFCCPATDCANRQGTDLNADCAARIAFFIGDPSARNQGQSQGACLAGNVDNCVFVFAVIPAYLRCDRFSLKGRLQPAPNFHITHRITRVARAETQDARSRRQGCRLCQTSCGNGLIRDALEDGTVGRPG